VTRINRKIGLLDNYKNFSPRPLSSLHFDTTLLGGLTDSSVLCSHGDTTVHVAVAHGGVDPTIKSGLPLKVEYRDRQYAHR
jgi:polyribonucleotide nucleotidyltransferase